MKFKINIDKKEYKKFNNKHGHVLQAIEWGEVKEGSFWEKETFGVYEDKKIVGIAMGLKRKIPFLNKYILYFPRGYVLDYNDNKLLKFFTNKLIDYCKNNNIILIKIDPCITKSTLNNENKKTEVDIKKITNNLQKNAYKLNISNSNFSGIQPKFCYEINIDNMTEKELLSSFSQKTRYNINLARKKGITVEEGSYDDLLKFDELMKITAKRDNFTPRSLEYFQRMYNKLYKSDQLKFFIAYYNPKLYMDKLEEKINDKKLVKNNPDAVENWKKELEELKDKPQDKVPVCGAIMLYNKDYAWYLYGASDNKHRKYMANYLLQWNMIKFALDEKKKIYSFRGVAGNLEKDDSLYGLYRFKKGFNGYFVEYIGEYDLYVSSFYSRLFKLMIKVRSILRRK